MLSLAEENKISKVVSIEAELSEARENPAAWYDFVLTIDWQALFSVLKIFSAIITISTFIYKALQFLRKRRDKKQIKRLKIDCTAALSLALKRLMRIRGGPPKSSRLIHLNKLAYHCVAVFVAPIKSPKLIFIITMGIGGRITNYNFVRL